MLWITRGKPSWPMRDRKGKFIKTSPVCNEFATISKQSTFIKRAYVIGNHIEWKSLCFSVSKSEPTNCNKNGLEKNHMSIKNFITMIAVFAFSVTLAACGGSREESVKLQGAGASFPAPLYLKWFKSYSGAHPNVQVDYQSVGSGSGVKSFMDRTVDFAASDAAMKPEEMAKVDGGVQLLPMTAGKIVLAHSLKEIPNLKLSRDAYVGIFSGKITKWNDPAIAKDNPDVKLPDTPINVIVRADSSGTTFVFTKHLSAISKEFAKDVGVNTMPNWPVGTKSKG